MILGWPTIDDSRLAYLPTCIHTYNYYDDREDLEEEMMMMIMMMMMVGRKEKQEWKRRVPIYLKAW